MCKIFNQNINIITENYTVKTHTNNFKIYFYSNLILIFAQINIIHEFGARVNFLCNGFKCIWRIFGTHTYVLNTRSDLIRGFATNTANYQLLRSVSPTDTPCNLENEGNLKINEIIYITDFTQTFAIDGLIIDTSRNIIYNTF